MPRKSPLSKIETSISGRFRLAREGAGLKQTELARKVGLNVNTLSSYEHGRNPMPYSIGSKIAKVTGACQRWLYSGTLPMLPFVEVDESVIARAVPKSALFSNVYAALLSKEIDDTFRRVAVIAGQEEQDLAPHSLSGWSAIWSPVPQQILDRIDVLFSVLKITATGLRDRDLVDLPPAFDAFIERWVKRSIQKRPDETFSARLEWEREGTAAHLRKEFEAYSAQSIKPDGEIITA